MKCTPLGLELRILLAGLALPTTFAARGPDFDMLVVGSGFAGSLTAMIGVRLGYRVAMVERGRHPRFVIGESSTPLANLLLEELALRHDLPELLPFVKWGSWQRERPEIACGLKRGFTFLHHQAGESWTDKSGRNAGLLVAASPRNEIADTQWYRPDLDACWVRIAQSLGVEYFDEWTPSSVDCCDGGGFLTGLHRTRESKLSFRLLVDATGGPGFATQHLGFQAGSVPGFPQLCALYSHFTDVPCWDDLHPTAETPPYPIDDAAVHHVFPEGWSWVLRFNNGITSAGVVVREEIAARLKFSSDPAAWRRLLDAYPSIREHLGPGRAVEAFRCPGPVAFRLSQVTAGQCVLLPSAAGFVDPMFSTGFPLTLLGVHRLADLLSTLDLCQAGHTEPLNAGLQAYGHETHADLDAAAGLLSSMYRVFRDFDSFRSLSMLYFTAAIHAETTRRLGCDRPDLGILLRKDPVWSAGMRECCDLAGTVPAEVLTAHVRRVIEPYNLGGLLDPARRHWYAADAVPMLEGAHKVGATREEMLQMMRRAGFQ